MAPRSDSAPPTNVDIDILDTGSFSRPFPAVPGRPLNRKYLRALHDYEASPVSTYSAHSSQSKTISLRAGDVVLVHLTHANGWADGTVLNTGHRGWLPTNYCEEFDHELVRHIFHALTTLWNICVFSDCDPRGNESTNDELQGFVHGVRYLLERAGCLHRHDPLVQSNLHIYKIRKSLLCDLAALVDYRKAITGESTDPNTPWAGLYEDYVLRAFRVATQSVKFLDVWSNEHHPIVSEHPIRGPPMRAVASTGSIVDRYSSPQKSPATPGSLSERHALIRSNAVLTGPPMLDDPDLADESGDGQTFLFPSGDTPSPRLPPSQASPTILSPSATLTLNASNSATKHLLSAHDQVKASISRLLCLPVQSICSSSASANTKDAVNACDDLIAHISDIRRTCSIPAPTFDTTIASLLECTSQLSANAIKISYSSSGSSEADTILDLARGRSLVKSAADCQRCAKICVAEARHVLQQYGDYAVDTDSSTPTPMLAQVTRTPPFYTTGFLPIMSPEPTSAVNPLVSPRINDLDVAFEPFTASFDDQDVQPSSLPSYMPSQLADPFGIDWSSPSTTDTFTSTGLSSRPNSSGSTEPSRTSTRVTTPDLDDSSGSETADRRQQQDTVKRRATIKVLSLQADDNDIDIRCAVSDDHESLSAELIQGKDGQILGGTLSALIECMTAKHSAPDPGTTRTFFLSFRSFTTPVELAETLIVRYKAIDKEKMASTPTKLRVFNMFKQWLECHWKQEQDSEALPVIREFAEDKSVQLLPSARSKLIALVEQAPLVPARELSRSDSSDNDLLRQRSLSKMIPSQPAPPVLISKAILTQVSQEKLGLIELEPLELARQLTLIVSRYYCAVTTEELLPSNLNKRSEKSPNVKALARISTDLANMAAHTILYSEDIKKRVAVLRHWIRVAQSCADLDNYDSLMAIMCALNSSGVARLKRTWSLVTGKQQAAVKELSAIVDTRKNYGALRQKLQTGQMPCLPFVGMFLTDLTFVDAGNPNTRVLPVSSSSSSSSGGNNNYSDGGCGGDKRTEIRCINFDKHARTVKIIEQFQSYQTPFNLQALPSLHDWLTTQFDRIRRDDGKDLQEAYQQSLRIEPREDTRSHLSVRTFSKESVPSWKQKAVAHLDLSKPRMANVLGKQTSSSEVRPKNSAIAA